MFADIAIHTAVIRPAATSPADTIPTFYQGCVHLHFHLLNLLNRPHGFHKAANALYVGFLRFFHTFTSPHQKQGCIKICIQVYNLNTFDADVYTCHKV